MNDKYKKIPGGARYCIVQNIPVIVADKILQFADIGT